MALVESYSALTKMGNAELAEQLKIHKLLERKTQWGKISRFQPAHRCVAHLVAIMIRGIKILHDDNGADVELYASQPEVGKWAKKNLRTTL